MPHALPRHSQRLLTALIALFALLLGGLTLTLQSAPAFAADACTPTAETSCIQGTIKAPSGDPLAGVTLHLTGAESQMTTTDPDGRWVFTVTTAGAYDVILDASTLPAGLFPKGSAERGIDTPLYNSTSALFPLTEDADEAAPPVAVPDDEAQPDGETSSGDEGATTGPGTDEELESGTADTGSADDTAASGGTGATGETSAGSFSWPRFWQQAASGIRMGLLLSLAAMGLSLVFGTTGVSNFAQGEMITVGGFLGFIFMSITGNIWLTGVITIVVMGAFGWVQDWGLWKPLRRRKLSLMQMMIVSIGFSIALQNLIQFFFGASIVRIESGTQPTVTIAGITLTIQSYWAMGIALLAVLAVGIALKYTRLGRATRAVADNPSLAEASGINVDSVIRIVWTAGTALAGLSGILLGLVLNGVAWNTGWYFLLLLFAAVVLGGIGTAFGAFIGAMIIGLIVETANIWLPGDLKHAAALFIMIVVLLVRPQGIFGRKERIG